MSVTVAPLTARVPATAVPSGSVSRKLLASTVPGLTGSEKTTRTGAPAATPVASAAGDRDAIAGAVVSGGGSVEKLQVTCAARGLPARSVTAVPMRTVYVVSWASGAAGSRVTVAPATETTAATGPPPASRRKLDAVTVAVSMTCDLGISADTPACEYNSLPAGVTLVSTMTATPNSAARTAGRRATVTAIASFEVTTEVDPDLSNNTASTKTKIIGRLPHP